MVSRSSGSVRRLKGKQVPVTLYLAPRQYARTFGRYPVIPEPRQFRRAACQPHRTPPHRAPRTAAHRAPPRAAGAQGAG